MQRELRPRPSRRGFTLIEAMVAIVIAGVACSALLLTVSQSMQVSEAAISASRSNLLAQELMTEISACRWTDAAEPNHWGPESGETTAQNARSAFDDLDDYDRWSGPPQTRTGQDYDGLQRALFPGVPSDEYRRYTCTVAVRYVSAAGAVLAAGQTSPYRRVTIDVNRIGQPPISLERTFEDESVLLGREHWFDPALVEPIAIVQIVPDE